MCARNSKYKKSFGFGQSQSSGHTTPFLALCNNAKPWLEVLKLLPKHLRDGLTGRCLFL